ncbi:MAG: universal stress protein E [Paraglaciecola sp.]|jgi:universal stress protein E
MKNPQRILVVVSGKRKQHPALQRALKFAEYNDVHLHLFNSIYEPVMELTDVLSSDHRKEMKRQYMADRSLYMEDIAATLDKKGIKCSINMAWHRELHEAIEQAVDELQPDLVIKHISAKTGSLNPFAMPTDRHLLRYCHAPLLLVKQSRWTNNPILAAVDPMAADPKHIALNHQVLEYSKMLAHVTETEAHAVNTYEAPIMSPSVDLPGIDYEVLRQETGKIHTEKMHQLLTENNFSTEHMHVVQGRPDIAIDQLANELEAQIVVLGTVGRTGLSAAFIGNTAENILASLTCEILTIKPELAREKNG